MGTEIHGYVVGRVYNANSSKYRDSDTLHNKSYSDSDNVSATWLTSTPSQLVEV